MFIKLRTFYRADVSKRDDNLVRFQALNDPKQPLVRMNEADREDLYARLAETIEVELDIERPMPNNGMNRDPKSVVF